MIHYHGTPITPDVAAIEALRAGHAFVSFNRPDQLGVAVEVCACVGRMAMRRVPMASARGHSAVCADNAGAQLELHIAHRLGIYVIISYADLLRYAGAL